MRKKKSAVHPSFREFVEQRAGFAMDLSDVSDDLKLSARLIAIAEPYNESMAFALLWDCAAIAWNECNHEDYQVSKTCTLSNMLLNYGNHRELIDALKRRKRQLYPDDRRGIRKVAVFEGEDDECTLNVAGDSDPDITMKVIQERLGRLVGRK